MKFCITLAERTLSALQAKLTHYSSKVEYLEVRLDYLDQGDLPEVRKDQATQLIATCRPRREGGLFDGSESDRLGILKKAAHSGFDFLDLELEVDEQVLELPESVRIIRSHHDFGPLPRDLRRLLQEICFRHGDISKLAVSVANTLELTRLLDFMEKLPSDLSRVIHGMGSAGQPSRYLGALLGNEWTYVSEDGVPPPAPGQFTHGEGQLYLRGAGRDPHTKVFGVLAKPVVHSLSPFLHSHLLRHYGQEGVYLPLEIDDAREWFDYVRRSRLEFEGFSVTLPLKTGAAEVMDTVDSPVSAVNTAARTGDLWSGFNTDFPGFLDPLRRRMDLQGKKALVLGNGGVAHTVVAALLGEGVSVMVAGRNPVKVARFAQQYGCGSIPLASLPFETDLVVNTTPVGQYPHSSRSILSEEQLKCRLVYDLVYHPARTQLLKFAQQKGIETISGAEMFVEQAAHQFRIWTGIQPDLKLMEDLLETALLER